MIVGPLKNGLPKTSATSILTSHQCLLFKKLSIVKTIEFNGISLSLRGLTNFRGLSRNFFNFDSVDSLATDSDSGSPFEPDASVSHSGEAGASLERLSWRRGRRMPPEKSSAVKRLGGKNEGFLTIQNSNLGEFESP